MKSNPTIYIKVPQSSYKMANEQGILKEYLFWYSLKGINIEGVFCRGEIIEKVKSRVDLSESNIRAKFSKLEKLGWITRSNNGGISLSKYDVVWNTLGIHKMSRDGIKIFRIITGGDICDIQSKIELEEIKDCLLKQSFAVSTSFVNQKLGEDTVSKPSVVNKKIRRKLLKNVDFAKMFVLQNKNILKSKSKINYDITLSCMGVAKLLGYTSAMQGYLIEQKLKKFGYLEVEKRLVYIGDASIYGRYLPSGYFITGTGKVMKQLSNKLTVVNKNSINNFNNTSQVLRT